MLGLPMKTPGVCYKSTRTLSHTSSAGKREELMASESQQSRVKCSQDLTDVSADGYTYICGGKWVYGVTLYLDTNIKEKNTLKITQFCPCQDGCHMPQKAEINRHLQTRTEPFLSPIQPNFHLSLTCWIPL